MLVLYLISMVFCNSKICIAIKLFSFHYIQKFATIVDIFEKSQSNYSIFLVFINTIYFFAPNITCN